MSVRTLRALWLSIATAALALAACGGGTEGSPALDRNGQERAARETPAEPARPATPPLAQRGTGEPSGAGKPGVAGEPPATEPPPAATPRAGEPAPAAPEPVQPAPVTPEPERDVLRGTIGPGTPGGGMVSDVGEVYPVGPAEPGPEEIEGQAECVCPVEPGALEAVETARALREEARYRHPDGSATRVAGGPPEGFERQPGTPEVYGHVRVGGFDRDPRGPGASEQ